VGSRCFNLDVGGIGRDGDRLRIRTERKMDVDLDRGVHVYSKVIVALW